MSTKRKCYLNRKKGRLVLVKRGFSWSAFFFGSLWSAAKGMWYPTFLVLTILDVAIWFLTGYAEATRATGLTLLGLACALVYAFARGRYGNVWLESSLIRRGYVLELEVSRPVQLEPTL